MFEGMYFFVRCRNSPNSPQNKACTFVAVHCLPSKTLSIFHLKLSASFFKVWDGGKSGVFEQHFLNFGTSFKWVISPFQVFQHIPRQAFFFSYELLLKVLSNGILSFVAVVCSVSVVEAGREFLQRCELLTIC